MASFVSTLHELTEDVRRDTHRQATPTAYAYATTAITVLALLAISILYVNMNDYRRYMYVYTEDLYFEIAPSDVEVSLGLQDHPRCSSSATNGIYRHPNHGRGSKNGRTFTDL